MGSACFQGLAFGVDGPLFADRLFVASGVEPGLE